MLHIDETLNEPVEKRAHHAAYSLVELLIALTILLCMIGAAVQGERFSISLSRKASKMLQKANALRALRLSGLDKIALPDRSLWSSSCEGDALVCPYESDGK